MKGSALRISGLRSVRGTRLDLLVSGGKILKMGRIAPSDLPDCPLTEIDGRGGILMPAMVDLCGFPDRQRRADLLRTECDTAFRSGFRTVVSCDPLPPEAYERFASRSGMGKTDVLACASLSPDASPILGDVGAPTSDPALLREALTAAKAKNSLVLLDGRHPALAQGYDPLSEKLGVTEKLLIAEETGCPVVFPLLSTAGGIEAVRRAKKRGIRVFCGTSPLHLTFTGEDRYLLGANALLTPPLGTGEDRDALTAGIVDGTVDFLVTGHLSLSRSDKLRPAGQAVPGAIGYQTALAACTSLPAMRERLPFPTLARLFSAAPASLLGFDPTPTEGGEATFTVVDPDEEWTVRAENMPGVSSITPLLGMPLRGRVKLTCIRGEWIV